MTQFRDKAGNIWEGDGPGHMQVVNSADESVVGLRRERWEADYDYGPMTEVNPHADAATSGAIRVELALVFDELAKEVWSPYNYSGVDDEIRSTVSSIFEEKARKLREAAE
ncbi:hypothetical protein AB0D97_14145 [Streptomyces roseus]|uniref:hypothetical protein n=1 Tax=Streptomyces roseus TaxID=66430 RepID=UPI0033D3C0F5